MAMLAVGAPYLVVGVLGLAGFLWCAPHAALYALGVLHDTQGGWGAESVSYAFVGFLAGMAALCVIPGALALVVASRRSLGALVVGVLCAALAGTWAWFSMLPFAACMVGLAVAYGVVGLVVCELGGDVT